jgi:hypothetical protein
MECEKCGRYIRKTCDQALPIAERTAANYLGRNIYVIAGTPGLFWLRGDRDSEMIPVVKARRRASRGNGWIESDLIRQGAIENKFRSAMEGKQGSK